VFAAAPITIPAVDLSSLSPYLQFAVKLAIKGKYTVGNIPKNEVRRAEIEAGWDQGLPDIPMSAKQVDALVLMTGFPDREAILQGIMGGKKRRPGSP
jgi:hypothetical protein